MRTDSLPGLKDYYQWNPYSGYDNRVKRTYNYMAYKRQRSDIIRTVPINGIFVKPTPYHCLVEYHQPGLARDSRWGEAIAVTDPLYTYENSLDHILPDSGALRNIANAARASLADAKANWGESIGELRGTANMTANALYKGAKVTQALARRDVSTALRELGMTQHPSHYRRVEKLGPAIKEIEKGRATAKSMSDFYLGTIFGWKPLIEDLATAVDLLAGKLKSQRTQGCTVIGYASRKQGYPSTKGKDYFHNPVGGGPVVIRREWSLRCKLFFRFEHSTTLAQLERFGLGNPLRTGWNLASMSFLVDQVLPVGNMLSALTSASGLRFMNGHISMKAKLESTISSVNRTGANGLKLVEMPTYRKELFVRSLASGDVQLPGFQLPFSGYNNGRDLERAVTYAALVAQRAPSLTSLTNRSTRI